MEWSEGQVTMAPRTFQDACGMEFHELLKGHSEKLYLDRYAQTCFVGEAMDELSGSDDQMLDDPNKPLTPAENEQLMLDQLAIPGAPLDEVQRRAHWRALPTRTRIAIRCLHRQFGYPLKFLLLDLRPQGRYRMVFGYHFVQNFDPGFCHLVSGPPLVPEFCIGSASWLPSSPDHSVGVWRANQ